MKNKIWQLPANIANSPNLTGNEKVLYSFLLSNPDAAVNPNTQDMAEICGVDKTTTLLSIKGLENAKLIKVKRTKAAKLKRMLDVKVYSRKPALPATRKKKSKKKRK